MNKEQPTINDNRYTINDVPTSALARRTSRGVEYLHMPDGSSPEGGPTSSPPIEALRAENSGETSIEQNPLPRQLTHVGHISLSDEDRHAALLGKSPENQLSVLSSQGSIGGEPVAELMKQDPVKRMEFVSSLPPERQAQAAGQLEVPRPIAGGAIDYERDDDLTEFEKIKFEREDLIAKAGSYANLAADPNLTTEFQRVQEIDEELGSAVRAARKRSGFNIGQDQDPVRDRVTILNIVNAEEARLLARRPDLEGALKYYTDRAILRAKGDLSLPDIPTGWEWELPAPTAPIQVDRLAPPEELRQGSEFQMAQQLFEYYSRIDPVALNLNATERARLTQEITDRKNSVEDLIRQADQNGVLVDVRKRLLKFYKEVMESRHKDKYGRDRQQVIDTARQNYAETFWNNSPELKKLESQFHGVATYLWDGVVREVDKEANNEQSTALNPVAEVEFDRVKQQRAIDRRNEKKYMVYESSFYGRTWELTAETPEELIAAAQDFVRDRIAEIQVSGTDVGTINETIQDIRKRGVQLLENNRVRLEIDTGQEFPETNPHYVRAIAMAEAVADVVGNEKVLLKGGEEIGPQYKERFASNFIPHHDAIYLENAKAAYIMHQITKHRNGTYWLGQPLDTISEKYSEGEIADYRREIEGEIVDDAANHDFFISEKAFKERVHSGHSFDDDIEKLLLDPGDQIRAGIVALGDAAALERHDLRVGVFRSIKAKNDAKERIVYNTPEERNKIIRQRIEQTMRGKGGRGYLKERTQQDLDKLVEARRKGDTQAEDKILWNWVEAYNQYNIRYRLPRWYPSGWDRVRMRIDRPTKLIDRGLSDEQFEAMFESTQLPNDESEKLQIINQSVNDSRLGFQLARSYHIFQMQDALLGGMRTRLADIKTGEYTGRLPDDEASLLLGMIRERIDPRTGQVVRGPDGKIIYDVVDPNRKLVRIFDIVQARLEAAISKEAADIDKAKTAKARAEASGVQSEINKTAMILRDKMVNAQFLPTHALKAIGLVDGKLPVWSYNFLDEAMLDVFMNTMADYGVEAAGVIVNNVNYGIPISHNQKKEFYEIVDRGRRALKAEYDRVVQEHMATSYPVFIRDKNGQVVMENGKPVRAKTLWRAADDFGEPGDMSERYRMINKGGIAEDRKLVDSAFEISTSGGIAVTELIPGLGDIGFYPLSVWLGVLGIKGMHGFIHRMDEVEFHHQKFFDVMDPVQHAKATAAGYAAKRSLTGGKIGEKSSPGVLKEPFHGAFKSASWVQKQFTIARQHRMEATANYISMIQQYRDRGEPYSHFLHAKDVKIQGTRGDQELEMIEPGSKLEEWRQLSYKDLGRLDKPEQDDFYTTMYGVLDYFQLYLQATKEVESNRRGRAPRNWEYNNTLRWYAFRQEMRNAMTRSDPEKGFILRLGYSPEVASELSIAMMETVLADGDFFILRNFERDRLALDGAEILSKALTDGERKEGFEVKRGDKPVKMFTIPPQSDWPSLRSEVRTALETIRRRGLLDFMKEEGFSVYDVEIDQTTGIKNLKKTDSGKLVPLHEVFGDKVPPLVQEQDIKLGQTRKRVSSVRDYWFI